MTAKAEPEVEGCVNLSRPGRLLFVCSVRVGIKRPAPDSDPSPKQEPREAPAERSNAK